MENLLSVFQNGTYVKESEMDGLGLCPYDPEHNSTAVLAGEFLHLPIVRLVNQYDRYARL